MLMKGEMILPMLALLLLLLPIAAADPQPPVPDKFWGTVKAGGTNISAGTEITVTVDDETDSVYEMQSSGYYSLYVIRGEAGDLIRFYVLDKEAGSYTRQGMLRKEYNLVLPSEGGYEGNHSSVDKVIEVDASSADTGLEIRTNTDVTGTPINVSKYSDNFFGNIGLGTGEEYVKSIDIDMNGSIIEYVIIKVYYTDSEISGLDEDSLNLYRYNETSGEWEVLDSQVNTEQNYVWANVTHFSVYGVFGEESTTGGDEEEDNGGGGGGGGCYPNWNCTEWGDCQPDGTQARTCTDLRNCNTDLNKPNESQSCEYTGGEEGAPVCEEDWTCTEWSECVDGQQSRSCTDQNACGTEESKPPESQACETSEAGAGGPPTGLFLDPVITIYAAVIGAMVLVGLGFIWWYRRSV
jgi:hypothetical protein